MDRSKQKFPHGQLELHKQNTFSTITSMFGEILLQGFLKDIIINLSKQQNNVYHGLNQSLSEIFPTESEVEDVGKSYHKQSTKLSKMFFSRT